MKHPVRFLSAALVLIAAMVLASVPAFAEDAPTEIWPENGDTLSVHGNGNYILAGGNYTVSSLELNRPAAGETTLTIPSGAAVTTDGFVNFGTVRVLGTLIVKSSSAKNYGTIRVGCGGILKTDYYPGGTVLYDEHRFEGGFCTVCGVRESEAGEGKPLRYLPKDGGDLLFFDNGNYLIRGGGYSIADCHVGISGICSPALTIDRKTTVTVEDFFDNCGIIHVLGTLNVKASIASNHGTIHVGCGGKLTGQLRGDGTVTYDEHTFKDGVCTVCGAIEPEDTETEPAEIAPKGGILEISDSGAYVLRGGTYTVSHFYAGRLAVETGALVKIAPTLTVPRDATVTVENLFNNFGTIRVLGTLILENCDRVNEGTIHVGCGGSLIGEPEGSGTVTRDAHTFEDGVCTVCGVRDCESTEKQTFEESKEELRPGKSGAIKSLTVIAGIAGAAVLGIGVVVIGKRIGKKH